MAQIEDQVLQEIRKQAQDNPYFALTWDALHAHDLNMSSTDDASTIMARNPDLPVPIQVKVSIQDNHGEILIALEDLKKLSQEEFHKLGAVMAETGEDLKAIDAQQDELIAFVKQWKADQVAAELERQERAREAAERQLKLQAAGAAIDLLSTFVGLVDPKLGRELAVAGRAGLEIYEAVVNYTQMAATFGSLGSGLGAVVLTGSVVGSMMNVTSLFGESGPPPEQLILEELRALREQVAQLHQDMHDRFDRVDVALNEIYTTINDRFNQVDLQLGKIRGDIKQIQQDLLRVELALYQLEARNHEIMVAAARRDLLMAINGAIGYKERTGLDMPYQPDYVTYENLFHSWAAIHAFDALSTGPTKRSYTDADVLRELRTYPLDVNLNYLNTWLGVHGRPALAQNLLPNPSIWGLASQAYSQFALDWPSHARRIAPIRAQEVKGVGDALQAALQRIVITDANRANFGLFEELLDYYTRSSARRSARE
jgi:hypothetical protein